MESKIYLAAAGSGKTTFLVNLLSNQDARILYTTFTDENAEVAMEMVYQRHGIIPPNITILPWFSFLLEHGVRPFQGAAGFGKEKFSGVDLGHEGVNFNKKGTVGYYVNGSNEVYAAKLPELALHCDECSAGAVVGRIKELFDVILIDEIQDMAGYDYDFIAALLHGGISLVMCGDERQSTYRTNTAKKNKGKSIEQYFEENGLAATCGIDRSTLNGTYRCSKEIIEFANKVYPEFPSTDSLRVESDRAHNGVWIVPDSLAQEYCNMVDPVILKNSVATSTVNASVVCNFGKAKGRTYDHVLIYPVKDVLSWLQDNSTQLKPQTRSKLYVAITRAKYSVGFVVPDNMIVGSPAELAIWNPQDRKMKPMAQAD